MITNHKNPRFSYLRRLVILPILALVVILVAFRKKETELTLLPSIQLTKTYTIVIDAGHGGKDRGAFSPTSKVTEAELTLQFAKAVKTENTNSNIKIILTRETDVFNSVQEKADFANAQKADLFISLHCNNAESIQYENGKKEANPAKGMEIYIANKEKAVNYNANAIFANELANSIKNLNHFSGIKSRNAGIWVLQEVKCPSVIIEAGFMTNQEDLKLMLDAGYQKKFAAGLLEGVQSYLASAEQHLYKTVSDTVIVRTKDTSKNNAFVMISDSINIRDSGKKPLIILDGKVQPNVEINKINPNSIEKIEVLKNESATVLYGDAGKNGVILITSKAPMNINLNGPMNPINSKAIFYVDGVKVDSGVFQKLDQNKIAVINVWIGEEAIEKYGKEAVKGVVAVNLKPTNLEVKLDQVQYTPQKEGVIKTVHLIDKKTIYFIDGVKSDSASLHQINPSDISSINVWKGADAIERFGKEAANGVIDVKLKQAIKKN